MPHRRCANPVPTSGHPHSSADALRTQRGQPPHLGRPSRRPRRDEVPRPAQAARGSEMTGKRVALHRWAPAPTTGAWREARGGSATRASARPSLGRSTDVQVSPKGSGRDPVNSEWEQREDAEASRRLAPKCPPHEPSAAGNPPPGYASRPKTGYTARRQRKGPAGRRFGATDFGGKRGGV